MFVFIKKWSIAVSVIQFVQNSLVKYNYHNSGHYPPSCLLFKAQRFGDWILCPSSDGTYSAVSGD
jgi:hypothetical protein